MHKVVLTFAVVIAGLVILDALLERVRKKYRMQMITCVIRPEQLKDVTTALKRASLMPGMTVTDVRGFGRQRGGTETSTDTTLRLLPKLRIEVLTKEVDVDQTLKVISDSLHTGQIGDGKIIVFEAVSTMRIRTGEKGRDAL